MLLALICALSIATIAEAAPPTQSQVSKITKNLKKPTGKKAKRLSLGSTGGRSVKCHSWSTYVPQCGGYWDWHAWSAANRRCGDWYNFWLANDGRRLGCVETVVEWGCFWINEQYRNVMAQCGTRWTNAGDGAVWRCRKGYIVYGWGDRSNPNNYQVYDHSSYPERCGSGYW